MPELPEVETVVTDLRSVLPNRLFCGLRTVFPPAIFPDPEAFSALIGQRVQTVERRGKYIVIFFRGEKVLVLHLRMTGRLRIAALNSPPIPFERTCLDFDAVSLRFGDVRKFGKVYLGERKNYEKISGIERLGPDPLAENLDWQNLAASLRRGRRAVKALLLDQALLAGVGNIYADEACFSAGISPARLACSLTLQESLDLIKSLRKELHKGIAGRGTSFSDFEDAFGRKGGNQNSLRVYGRGKQNCLSCHRSLLKIRVAGRGTVYCSRCQL